jgi:RNA polymerase sigma factor (sigma-70 family)
MSSRLPLSDRDLARRLARQRPDEADVAEAYRRFFTGMLAAAAHALPDGALAAEVAQDALTKVLTNGSLGRLKDPERLRQFLESAARHAAIDHLRRASRQARLQEAQEPLAQGELAPVDAEAEKALGQRFDRLLVRLRPGEAEILRQRIGLGMTLSEIARAHGVSYAAAAQRLARALQAARKKATSVDI